MHTWSGIDQGGETIQISSVTIVQIDYVRVMIKVVGHGVAATVSPLAETVELDLSLMIGNRVIRVVVLVARY